MQKYIWLSWILINLSFIDRNRKVKQMKVVEIHKTFVKLENVSSFRELTINDTINILEKDSIYTYIFKCEGAKYAQPYVINMKKVEKGDIIHILK